MKDPSIVVDRFPDVPSFPLRDSIDGWENALGS
jgi:hypothetical protein